MSNSIKTVSWKFNDCSKVYPELPQEKIYIQGPEDVFHNFLFLFKQQVKERFICVWLNAANRVIGFEVVTEGILNSSLVHPREVFRGAIVATCAAIIIAHNHPSGNTEPSTEDLAITKQIVEAGKVIGIPLHDHIIFNDEAYVSFAERGLM
jgi:DNA repair protein RadC